jgi:hypothetical protein
LYGSNIVQKIQLLQVSFSALFLQVMIVWSTIIFYAGSQIELNFFTGHQGTLQFLQVAFCECQKSFAGSCHSNSSQALVAK